MLQLIIRESEVILRHAFHIQRKREIIPKLLNLQWCHDNGENSTCFVWLQNLRLNDLDMNSQIICLLTSVILTDFADLIQ